MSATDQMRAMLNELMGSDQHGDRPHVQFDDSRVCKSFLLGCCPHEILNGTRMDIGECAKIHELALKADYAKDSKRDKYFFEYDALEQLEAFIRDTNRRTEVARRRLKETQEELSEDATAKAEEIHRLGEEVGTKLARAEQLGADGQVEESLKLMAEVEELNKTKAKVEMEFRNTMPASSSQQQKLRVCEVCSAYLGVHDNDRRLADHFGGKLHLGFIEIRNRLDELRATVATWREERTRSRDDRRQRPSSTTGEDEESLSRVTSSSSGAAGSSSRRERSDRDRDRVDRQASSSSSRHHHRHHHKRSSRRSRSRSRDRRSRSRESRRDRKETRADTATASTTDNTSSAGADNNT